MIKILHDRVIFDGHAEDKATCETTTLLANALAKSEDFKQVEYRSGYAEFEKVGKAGELKFVPDGTLNIYSNDGSSHLFVNSAATVCGMWTVTTTGLVAEYTVYDNTTYTYSGSKTFIGFAKTANAKTPTYAIGDTIFIDNGTNMVLYIVESDPTPTISFKHFYKNDTLIGTGAYKFRRYSVEKPASGYTISWTGGGLTPSVEVSINGGGYQELSTSTGTIQNVRTLKFMLNGIDFSYQATVESTTLGLKASHNKVTYTDTYTLTQDVTDIVCGREPEMTIG